MTRPAACRNPGVGRYCPACGQRALGRLDARQLLARGAAEPAAPPVWRDFSNRYPGLEGAALRTVLDLTIRHATFLAVHTVVLTAIVLVMA